MSVRNLLRATAQVGNKPTATSAPVRVDDTDKAIVVVPGGPGATTEYAASLLEETAGAVTQTTGITTGVTLNARRGIITTVTAPAIAAGAEAAFAVTNSFVNANSVIAVAMGSQFTDGDVIPYVKSIGSGTFTISLTNVGAAAVSAGAATIRFAIL